jgi:hypothetical protein
MVLVKVQDILAYVIKGCYISHKLCIGVHACCVYEHHLYTGHEGSVFLGNGVNPSNYNIVS